MAKRRKVNNLMALALLGLLATGQPMHPYEMASLLRSTGKDQNMKIKWGSLYTVVQNLEKHGFIQATGSNREGRRPERTVYTITPAGRAEVEDWLRELVAVPEPEHLRFEAALSILGVLSPDEVAYLLDARVRALDGLIEAQEKALEQGKGVPRVFLVEAEFALSQRKAEAAWVRGLRKEMVDGSLSGVTEWRSYHETGEVPPEWAALLKDRETPSGG